MRVCQVNTYTGAGGAAIAALRLNRGLRKAGVESEFLSTYSDDREIVESGTGMVRFGGSLVEGVWRRWRQWQLQQLRARYQPRPSKFDIFSYDLSCYGMALLKSLEKFDVINFHWVCDFLDYPYLLQRLNPKVPVVWTLHDLNPATGGCFYPVECTAFKDRCGACPKLGSNSARDMSTEIWERKAKSLQQLRAPLVLVSPSQWLAGEAHASGLLARFPIRCIPNGVDTETFRPRNRAEEKLRLGLKPEAPVILFVASLLDNPLKGLRRLIGAMPAIREQFPAMQFAALGEIDSKAEWPVPITSLGARSNEEDIARIYASADLLVVPSAADNFPNVLIEAMACGVPAVGFAIGGIPEAIRDGETGMLAREQTSQSLAGAIGGLLKAVVADRERWERQCRSRAVREYALAVQAGRYEALYRSLLPN